MRVVEPGHVYILDALDNSKLSPFEQHLHFVNREPGHEHPGTQTQDVLRCLIDRTYHCDGCLPDDLNASIIFHLRMALVCHEMRALRRKAEKGIYAPEDVKTGPDGHFALDKPATMDGNLAPRRVFPGNPAPPTICNYRKY